MNGLHTLDFIYFPMGDIEVDVVEDVTGENTLSSKEILMTGEGTRVVIVEESGVVTRGGIIGVAETLGGMVTLCPFESGFLLPKL